MIERSYRRGRAAALRALKLAGPMGADMPVAPRGEEQSHGTRLHPYVNTGGPQQDPDMPDRLWDLFGQDNPAPGGAGGQYGSETIG